MSRSHKRGAKIKRKFTNGLALVGDVFYYRFKFKGKPIQGSTGCHRIFDAREKLLAIKTEKSKEASGIITRKVPTFAEAVDLWYNARIGKRSQSYLDNAKRQMEMHVIPKLGKIRCDQITATVVDAVATQYLHGNTLQVIRSTKVEDRQVTKKHTVGGYNTLLSWISAVLGNLVPDYMPSAPKLEQVKQQERRNAFVGRDQVAPFLEEVDRTGNLHVSIAVRAMLYLGLRESESLKLLWSNLNWADQTYSPGGSVQVNPEDTTKGKESATLPCPSDMMLWFRKVKDSLPEGTLLTGWILPAEDGKPHRKQFTKKAVIRGGLKVGLVLTPHRLRGTFATLLAKNKTSPYVIKDMLRHRQLATTLKYVSIGMDDMKEASKDLWGA